MGFMVCIGFRVAGLGVFGFSGLLGVSGLTARYLI